MPGAHVSDSLVAMGLSSVNIFAILKPCFQNTFNLGESNWLGPYCVSFFLADSVYLKENKQKSTIREKVKSTYSSHLITK